MSIRRIAVQQLGNILRLPIADLDRMGEPLDRARIDGVDRIILNTSQLGKQVFVPERSECHADEAETIECIRIRGRRLTVHVMECSACGRTYEHVNGPYEYCPRCRAEVVAE